MKYVSDYTGKTYDTIEACEKADKAYQAEVERKNKEASVKAAERKEAANRVEAARTAYKEAYKNYQKELNDFCSKYGSFHTSLKPNEATDLFDWLTFFI